MTNNSMKDIKSNKNKLRLLFLSSLIITLILVYITQAWLVPTLSRYVKRERDEIRAYYTSLYFDTTGHGKTIALEDGVGYIDFDVRNYIGENVTQRDIVYSISKPTVFYKADKSVIGDQNNDGIVDNTDYEKYLSEGNKLHVLDVWGNAKQVEDSTYLYDVEIVQNNGEVVADGIYTFTYEKLGSSAKGKTHSLTCKVERTDGEEAGDDLISLVIQLTKPYKEVVIVNMRVSNKLITFSHKEIDIFNVPFDKLYIQSADLFAYYKNNTVDVETNTETPRTNTERTTKVNDETSYYKYTPYAFKLTIYWSGYILDEEKLEEIHIGTSSVPGLDKNYDTVGPNGEPNNIGAIPNPNVNSPYLDIEQATIARINSVYDEETGHRGEMIIFVPQGSDFFFHFIKSSTTGTVDVKIEAYVTSIENGVEVGSSYQVYTEDIFGGYFHNYDLDDGEYLYNLMNYSK